MEDHRCALAPQFHATARQGEIGVERPLEIVVDLESNEKSPLRACDARMHTASRKILNAIRGIGAGILALRFDQVTAKQEGKIGLVVLMSRDFLAGRVTKLPDLHTPGLAAVSGARKDMTQFDALYHPTKNSTRRNAWKFDPNGLITGFSQRGRCVPVDSSSWTFGPALIRRQSIAQPSRDFSR